MSPPVPPMATGPAAPPQGPMMDEAEPPSLKAAAERAAMMAYDMVMAELGEDADAESAPTAPSAGLRGAASRMGATGGGPGSQQPRRVGGGAAVI